MLTISHDDPVAVAAVDAIRGGDVEGLKRLLRGHPNLVTARSEHDRGDRNPQSCTLLHEATDWPGHFPNGLATVTTLAQAGADVNARVAGPHTETPLHWAASSDDIDVLNGTESP